MTQSRPDKPGEYTAGGLYRPGEPDGGPAIPPDIRHLKEPVPKNEPRARYGNRSPYTVLGKSYRVMDSASGYAARGIASWYGSKFHGRATSSLEPYDMYQFTAAHKSLPLPSFVRVTHLINGRSIVVRVNDRGPFHDDRLIDLSYAAAIKLGMHEDGTAPVEVRVLEAGIRPPEPPAPLPAAQAWAAARAGLSPEPASATAKAPVSELPDEGPFWIQLASFGSKANARQFLEQLSDGGIRTARMQRAEVNGRKMYRVRIGPLQSRHQAEPLLSRITALGLGPPVLTRD